MTLFSFIVNPNVRGYMAARTSIQTYAYILLSSTVVCSYVYIFTFFIVVPFILITSRFHSPTNALFYETPKMLKLTVKTM